MNSNKYEVAIIDDSVKAQGEMIEVLKSYSSCYIVGLASNGAEGKKMLMKTRPQILFLDVELPDTDAMQWLENLRFELDWEIYIVLYTAYSKYMIKAVRESLVFDFLTKPIVPKELFVVMGRIFEAIEKHQYKPIKLIEKHLEMKHISTNVFLMPTLTNELRIVHLKNIGYFKFNTSNRQWLVFLSDKTILNLRKNVTARIILHSSECFVQTHSSYIINIDYLQLIKPDCCLMFPPFDEDNLEIPVSQSNQKKLRDRFLSL